MTALTTCSYHPVPSTSTLPTLASLSARFASALNTLQTSHTVDSAALLHFTHEREELDTQEAELKAEVEQTGMKGRFFGDFKIFIEEVAAFLDEKVRYHSRSCIRTGQ